MVSYQIKQVVEFFPNYLAYGSQYGERFVGEFYGPAVLHCQDMNRLNTALAEIVNETRSPILVQDDSCPYSAPLVRFSARNMETHYSYAVSDYLHSRHLIYNKAGFDIYLKDKCVPWKVFYFPGNIAVYTIHKCE